ncbi:hypothetical protein PRZ48_007679 [Zasmidium cellare]|uniref:Heterokaryon incompatibility domain-containing protein n=1 Tax=Zasmidium cellare TaxID=395010 RepID=A0ABR0EL29_ZASCE|nr:hypothetical protein PRZ48_007679 [Zasmidium cellare]
MRLINVHTLEFGEFFEIEAPPYAILSHRWSTDEITYKDFLKGRNHNSEGFRKVSEFCAFIRDFCFCDDSEDDPQPVDWAWVDTCCIDKKSSAELSETINAMYRYYQEAHLCVVYLVDLECREGEDARDSLQQCSWFWRGWTLQELIAPPALMFCDPHWSVYGTMKDTSTMDDAILQRFPLIRSVGDLLADVSAITKIPQACLTGNKRHEAYTIAQRMSWAAHRSTTRTEDEAYCLLGIFEVNMPLIYGEGLRAFERLQEEIIKRTTDQSILAWTNPPTSSFLLAPRPRCFTDCGEVDLFPTLDASLWNMTNLGLEMHSDLLQPRDRTSNPHEYLLRLNCTRPNASGGRHRVLISLVPHLTVAEQQTLQLVKVATDVMYARAFDVVITGSPSGALQHTLGLGGCCVVTVYKRADGKRNQTMADKEVIESSAFDYNPATDFRYVTQKECDRARSRRCRSEYALGDVHAKIQARM